MPIRAVAIFGFNFRGAFELKGLLSLPDAPRSGARTFLGLGFYWE
jgi:hypothetical protein